MSGIAARPAAPPAPPADESRQRLAAMARMYYLDNLGQHEIARIVGLSRSQVSRLLTRARELGIVRITVEDHDPRDRDLEACLIQRFGLRHAIVVRTPERATEHVRRTIGYVAGPVLSGLVRDNTTLGVAGGRTLAEAVAFMAPVQRVSGVSAVQLMGNIGPAASAIDAGELSRTLAQRFGGAFYTISAPAIVQDRAARDLLLAHDHIRLVRDLFDKLQLALIGVGSLDDSASIERGVLPADSLARLRAQGTAGEICGRFYDAAGQECRSEYRDRVISVDLEALRRCPEVIAVTNDPARALAVRAALAGRLITSLVVDDRGARALLELAP